MRLAYDKMLDTNQRGDLGAGTKRRQAPVRRYDEEFGGGRSIGAGLRQRLHQRQAFGQAMAKRRARSMPAR